jgi:predicted Zn-dependent peptidase
MEDYNNIAAKLDQIIYSNTQGSASADSNADELRKFKGLLDDGIISQAEFDEKKKELLGL